MLEEVCWRFGCRLSVLGGCNPPLPEEVHVWSGLEEVYVYRCSFGSSVLEDVWV